MTKILKHYGEYFALLEDGHVATFLGYENGKVEEAEEAIAKEKRTSQHRMSPRLKSTTRTACGDGWQGSGSQISYWDRLNGAANKLWLAAWDCQDENQFRNAVEAVHQLRLEIWENNIRLPPPPEHNNTNTTLNKSSEETRARDSSSNPFYSYGGSGSSGAAGGYNGTYNNAAAGGFSGGANYRTRAGHLSPQGKSSPGFAGGVPQQVLGRGNFVLIDSLDFSINYREKIVGF